MNARLFILSLVLLLTTGLLTACNKKEPTTLVSEKPASENVGNVRKLQAQPSTINIRTRIRLSDIQSMIESELPANQDGAGEQRQCKRVLGIKLCGTAHWLYNVKRGPITTLAADDDRLELQIPLSFSGNAGIQGDVAKALKLGKLDFDGALLGNVKIGLDLDEQWCPVITAQVEYQWQKKPEVEWIAGLDMDLSDQLDRAIKKQLDGLDNKLKDAIDCAEFKSNIAAHWRRYSFPISVTETDTMHLNLQPVSFAFSGMHTNDEFAGVSFTLVANTLLESSPVAQTQEALPPLKRTTYKPGQSVFEFLIRSNYNQLAEMAKPVVVNTSYSNDNAAGKVEVTINDLHLSGNNEGVTLKLVFDAKLPGSRSLTKGEVYLTASPQVDLLSQEISLINIRLSKVLDSAMWNAVASLFENKIIKAIEDHTLWDVHEQIEELEKKLLAQLNDPTKTQGLEITAQTLQIELKQLLPEQNSLAALLNVETDMDIVIPDTVLIKQR
ncbi:MAG: DUF4403 family protein [Granulosicoccaceae bacterium]